MAAQTFKVDIYVMLAVNPPTDDPRLIMDLISEHLDGISMTEEQKLTTIGILTLMVGSSFNRDGSLSQNLTYRCSSRVTTNYPSNMLDKDTISWILADRISLTGSSVKFHFEIRGTRTLKNGVYMHKALGIKALGTLRTTMNEYNCNYNKETGIFSKFRKDK